MPDVARNGPSDHGTSVRSGFAIALAMWLIWLSKGLNRASSPVLRGDPDATLRTWRPRVDRVHSRDSGSRSAACDREVQRSVPAAPQFGPGRGSVRPRFFSTTESITGMSGSTEDTSLLANEASARPVTTCSVWRTSTNDCRLDLRDKVCCLSMGRLPARSGLMSGAAVAR